MKKAMEKKKKNDKMDKKDECVLCGKETKYFFRTPIQEREYYVVGVGQLCDDCGKIYYNV